MGRCKFGNEYQKWRDPNKFTKRAKAKAKAKIRERASTPVRPAGCATVKVARGTGLPGAQGAQPQAVLQATPVAFSADKGCEVPISRPACPVLFESEAIWLFCAEDRVPSTPPFIRGVIPLGLPDGRRNPSRRRARSSSPRRETGFRHEEVKRADQTWKDSLKAIRKYQKLRHDPPPDAAAASKPAKFGWRKWIADTGCSVGLTSHRRAEHADPKGLRQAKDPITLNAANGEADGVLQLR